MGLEAEKTGDAAARLLAAGRVLLGQGGGRFSLARLCAEAGVTLEDFQANFAGKADLLQQLLGPQAAAKEDPAPADPWLERRLRVFERALGALEEKSGKRDREYRQAIARLEEKLAALGGAQARDAAEAAERALEEAMTAPDAEAPGIEEKVEGPAVAQKAAAPDPLALAPLEPAAPPPGKADSEFLEAGRRAARAHARALQQPPRRRPLPLRLLLVTALAMAALLLCAVLALGHAGDASAAPAGEGTAHRLAPASPLQKLMARADSGDAVAQRELALAYLRGQGVPRDETAAARWALAAADAGEPQAQYLAGSFYRDGIGVARDPARAAAWFARAAAAGELKAMHNLAIAYIQGDGVGRDDAAAASWFAKAAAGGYVDSAFDLAVLYEKGQGVRQDPRQALRWYRAAAAAGDAQAAARAKLLAEQVRLQPRDGARGGASIPG
jgi:TPR repeat protein